MLRHRVYYGIKPFLPVRLRRSVRGLFARRARPGLSDVWPIAPGSEKAPEGWPGWPDDKKFAVILTHDVEGQRGFENIHKLIELEKRLGFRSSYNLIPEGEYRVTPGFRKSITDQGFEVGVHDLRHDGKLLLNEEVFARNAEKINHYLQDWGATGFRAGFMLHNLEWFHQLKIAYDLSTFDTDPFEPQPDGVHTIFPFWAPRPNQPATTNSQLATSAEGYVEMPYTLPQDSTLFLILKERHPDIWIQKLDWIAQHGGMVLLNVHPDYLQFPGQPASANKFPVDRYARFLEYLRDRYPGQYWQPLARDAAAFTAAHRPRVPRRPRRICMVTHSCYVSDARVTRYAEALANRGDSVEVLALQPSAEHPRTERIRGVDLVRIQPRFAKNEKSRLSFLLPVLRFLRTASWHIAREHSRRRYDLLHIHNIPDFVVFAGLYPRLHGAKVILDIHDIVPEFYASKFGAGPNSFTVKALKCMERVSARVAHHVIIANHLWLDTYRNRTGTGDKSSVFINNVDTEIFRPRPRTRDDGKFIIIFPGGLQWHQGLDIAIRAFEIVVKQVPNVEFHIIGDGNMREQLIALAKELGLEHKVLFFKPVPVREVAELMANADLGVVPKRADSFGNEAYSTKIMEFMSLGIPVVVSSTKIDRFYFNDSVVRFFESGNVDALADAMLEVIQNTELRERMTTAATAYAQQNSWEVRKKDYLHLVDALISGEGKNVIVPPGPLDRGSRQRTEDVTQKPESREHEPVVN